MKIEFFTRIHDPQISNQIDAAAYTISDLIRAYIVFTNVYFANYLSSFCTNHTIIMHT